MAALDFDAAPYAYANLDPILNNDPTGLVTNGISDSTHPSQLPTAQVTHQLDVAHGQVMRPQGWFWEFWSGPRSFPLHFKIGNKWYVSQYEVTQQGYLTQKPAKNLLTYTGEVPGGGNILKSAKKLKAVLNLKNWIKARYVVYQGLKFSEDGKQLLLYFGKAKNSIFSRYTAKRIDELSIQVIDGLENIPNNAAALGIEQLVMDLNGGIEGGQIANKMEATVKQAYIQEGLFWLEQNLPDWETLLKAPTRH